MSKKWKLWSSEDGGHTWGIIGKSDDQSVLRRQLREVVHNVPSGVADFVILPDDEQPNEETTIFSIAT